MRNIQTIPTFPCDLHAFSLSLSRTHGLTHCCFPFALPSYLSPQGYRQKDSYIASQGPLQHTLEDFWRMIWEWRSCSIVMLTELEERGQVSSGRRGGGLLD